jgi:restriction system protein
MALPVDAYPQLDLSPEDFERHVKLHIDAMRCEVKDYQSRHREEIRGFDGEYEIDITVRFSVIGVEYLTLVECKRCKRPIEREDVQVLWTKMKSVGAHKGILYATSGFQSGAIEFAEVHGIALVTLADGRSSYFTKALLRDSAPKSWDQMPECVPRIVGWLRQGNRSSLISDQDAQALAKGLGFVNCM